MSRGRWLLWAIAAMALAGLFRMCNPGCGMPSDEEMQRRWRMNLAELTALKDWLAAQSPGIRGISFHSVLYGDFGSFATPREAGVSEDHVRDVIQRMERLDVMTIQRSQEETRFLAKACGFGGSGFRVFFVYRPKAPEQMVSCIREVGLHTTGYVPLGGAWYVKVAR